MPELPEVEVVRKGLAQHVKNRKVDKVKVRNNVVEIHFCTCSWFGGLWNT